MKKSFIESGAFLQLYGPIGLINNEANFDFTNFSTDILNKFIVLTSEW